MKRRHFLHQTGLLISRAAAPRLGGSAIVALAASSPVQLTPGDPTQRQGRPATPYGQRSRFETVVRTTYGSASLEARASLTPLQELHGSITPSALHYERHHAGVPEIDPATHRLLLHGLVKRPLLLTLEELKRFPCVSRPYFLECSGNSASGVKSTGKSVQETHGLTSCSEWTGVPLSVLLHEGGVDPQATWIVAEGADGAAMTRSIPVHKCVEDVMVAYAQNGEALRPEQGYPVRLIVPGWEGSINIKWLRRIKVVDQPYQTREETAKYTDLMPDGTARQFTFVMEAKSVITCPSGGHKLPGPGFYEVRGLAWSGRGRIQQVQVSTDGGTTWYEAELQQPILPQCHTRFRFPWIWNGEETMLQSRCIDETGYVQPTREALIRIRGIHSNYHFNAIQSWKVGADRNVSNA